jgi:hypothetical protein
MKYNEGQPKLPWELGRYVSQKIGKADEVKQYRRLFAADNDYRESLPPDLRDSCLDFRGRPDNWLLGKGWYEKAVDMVESSSKRGITIGTSPLMYHSGGPLCQMYYADRMEKEGTFGEVAKGAWEAASKDWHDYGEKRIPCSLWQKDTDEPFMIRLNDKDKEENAAREALAELEKLQPGLRKKMSEDKKAGLTPAQRKALDMPAAKRSEREHQLAAQAEEAIQVGHDEVARKVSDAKKKETAKRLAREAVEHELLAAQIRNSRNVVNFDYWRKHSAAEQGRDILDARQCVYKGDRALADGDLRGAYAAYQEGLHRWRKALDAHKEYIADQTSCEDLMDMIKRYRYLLTQREEAFPKDFILQDVIDSFQRQNGEAPFPTTAPPAGKKPSAKPAEKEGKKPDTKKVVLPMPSAKKAEAKKSDADKRKAVP